MAERLSLFMRTNRWIWPFLGVLILWIILASLTARFSLHSLSGVAISASFLLLPALGQMLVITTGKGNIDLSIPGVVTLSAYLSVYTATGSNTGFVVTLAVVSLIAGLIGLCNAILVLLLRIPAMIATLATGYILATATLIVNSQIGLFTRPPALGFLAAGRIFGFPVICVLALVAVAATALLLSRSAYGRKLFAVGQSAEAAYLTGIRVAPIIASTFVASSVVSGLTGVLLSGYAGGAFLEMGTPYLLQSVGAVVLGGTLIAGGSATALGTLFGGMLLVMIVTTMQIAGLPPGAQDILQGIVVISVLSVAGTKMRR
ncbi:MAG: ABC transporter permease [Rhizobiaceae bacterium]|nr:ABC transporter permease [Rhizobiaceae bacterium]